MINLKHCRILFLEDNITFASHTSNLLKLYSKEVIHCVSMTSAKKLFDEEKIDIIISDMKVEDGIALDFITHIREYNKTIPIVILSAHKDEKFLLDAIPLGLTSYCIKPLDLDQFEIVLKRCSDIINDQNPIVYITDTVFYNFYQKTLTKHTLEITLNKKESAFIEMLIKNKNKLVTKDQIEHNLWTNEQMSDSALKNFLLRLRKKIGKDIFCTVSGLGYKLNI